MVYCDNPIIYNNFKIELKINEIVVTNFNDKDKYIRCKNKLKLLLLYQYIKLKNEKVKQKIYDYIKYMINIPLHENLIQDIIKNNIKNCSNNKKINNKLRKKRYIMEYRILCEIIEKEVIIKNKKEKSVKYISKLHINIDDYIDYNKNKICDKTQIMNITGTIKTILHTIKDIIDIEVVYIYVTQLIICMHDNDYQNPLFILMKDKILKEINNKSLGSPDFPDMNF